MITAHQLVERALSSGARDAEICRDSIIRKEVFFEKNEIKSIRADERTDWGVRAFIGGRAGFASTNDVSMLEETVDEAARIARASDDDPFNGLPASERVYPVSGLVDEKEVSLSEIVSAGIKLVETAKKYDARISVDSAAFSWEKYEVEIVSSQGIACRQQRTMTSYFIMGVAVSANDVSSFDYSENIGIRWDQTTENIEKDAIRFAKAVKDSLGARPVPAFTGFALLSPETSVMIPSLINFLVNARNVQERRSRFAGKLGQKIASEMFTLIDDPEEPETVWSRAFDREGVPARKMPIITGGVLDTFIYDTYAGRKHGRKSTGHASGSAASAPSISLHAPKLMPTHHLSELWKMVERGVYIRRFSGNADPVSGIISGLVKGGRYIEDGSAIFPVTDTMIHLNLDSLFNGICAVSYEKEPTFAGCLPYVLVQNVDILGK